MSGLVVGVDYDSYKATLVALPLDGSIGKARKAVAPFRPSTWPGEDAAIVALGHVRPALGVALASLTRDASQTVVWVERGYGMSRRADWILGAFFGAIWASIAGWPVAALNPLDLREWKEIVTRTAGIGLVKDGTRGNGNAKKEVANEACRGLLGLGEIDGSDWTPDELDAFGIAFAGRDLNRQALAVG